MGTYLSKLCCCRRLRRDNLKSDLPPVPNDNLVFENDIENARTGNENHHISFEQQFPISSSRRNVQHRIEINDGRYQNVCITVALYNYTARESSELTFNQGDEIEIFGEMEDNWWDGQLLNPPYTKGLVPYNYVAKKGTIEAQPYFYGQMSRREAEEVLSSSEISTFLVRASGSRKDSYAVSVQSHPQVEHFLIYKDAQGYFIHTAVKKNTVPLLIEYHQKQDCGMKKLGHVYYNTSNNWEIERTSLKLGQELGSGNFGSVYKATYNRNIQVAVKTLKKGCLDSESFLKEADIMKRLIHPRIVRLFGVCTVGDPFYIVTELMPHGDLYKYLKEGNGQRLDEQQLVDIATQVASGMAYLENNRYVHRDLAARNVLVGENILCKISDFGFARLTIEDDLYVASIPGIKVPIRWTAPEAMRYQRYTVKSDVWSFGILLTEIIEKGMKPYPGQNRLAKLCNLRCCHLSATLNRSVRLYNVEYWQLNGTRQISVVGTEAVELRNISNNQDILPQLLQGYRMSHTLMPNCPSKLYDLMQACWENDPKLRPSFADLFYNLENFYGPAEYDPYNT